MNCPKYVAAALSFQGFIGEIDVTCDREECAWWDKLKKECAILRIATTLDVIGGVLNGIKSDMPSEWQRWK